MKIDVVIPNYNGSSLIKKNLTSVIATLYDYKDSRIIIVDDHSKQEDYESLQQFVHEVNEKYKGIVHLLRNKRNFGFATTANNGVRAATADLVVLLNSDVAPEKEFLRPIIEDFEKDELLFGVGCMDKSIEEDKTIVLRGRGKGKWTRGFLIHRKAEVEKGNDTLWVSGGSSVIRREFFEKIGGFDSIYNPFYWEDIDLSYRALKSGYHLLFEKRSVVIHSHEEGAIKKHFSASKVNTIAYRNQFLFVWKNITDTTLLFSHICWLPYHMVKAAMRFDKPFFVGLGLAAVKISMVFAKRRRQKRLYTKTDREVIRE